MGVFFVLWMGRLTYLYVRPPLSDFVQTSGYFPEFAVDVKNYASYERKGKFQKAETQPEGGSSGPEQKYEKIADLRAQSTRFDDNETQIRAAIKKYDGVVQYENLNGLAPMRSLQLAVGVRPESFDSAVAVFRKIGIESYFNVSKTDKTDEFNNLRAQRASWEAVRASLLELKKRPGNINELVTLENRLLEVEQELQRLGVQMGEFSEENELCTIKLTLAEGPAASAARPGFFDRLSTAFEWAALWYAALTGVSLMTFLAALLAVVLYDKWGRVQP